MSIKRINEFPEGSGSLSNDDVFLFMDDVSNGGTTKKISLSQIGDIIGGNASILKSTYSSSNEGGEIQLAKPVNSSLSGSVIIDVYQDKLRIFEGDGNSRGGYFDLTTMGNNASTNLFGIPSNTGLVPNSIGIINMVSISQSNYDAIVTKDPNTLYIINN
jgi:hypothetical protein